jgi:hypothetical protein
MSERCWECEGTGQEYAGDPETGEGVFYGCCPVCGGSGYQRRHPADDFADEDD